MIGLITYDAPHRKTQDVLFRLLALGHDVRLLVLPWEERKNHTPLFLHRPRTTLMVSPSDLAIQFGLEMSKVETYGWQAAGDCERILIGGAGVLPPLERPVINSHPGYLPIVRGLDALKWAIYDGLPVGVTTHAIGEECDTGKLIAREILTPAFTEDFGTFAHRVYELEVEMLAEAAEAAITDKPLLPEGALRRRMPHKTELAMMARFEKWRRACA